MTGNNNTTLAGNAGRIAFVQSCWHADIVDQCRDGFADRLEALGISENQVNYFCVPGAFEIPLKCRQLIATGEYALVVAAGFVVDGGIYRHEFVAQAVINALMQVQLETNVPVLSAVLTPKKEFQETEAQQRFFLAHMQGKGREAAEAAFSLLSDSDEELAKTA